MMLRTLYPDASDLRLVELAIRSFPNAGGNVDRAGRLSESVDPNRLWLMISVSAATMATLWGHRPHRESVVLQDCGCQ
jgi:hypothetical protein